MYRVKDEKYVSQKEFRETTLSVIASYARVLALNPEMERHEALRIGKYLCDALGTLEAELFEEEK